LNPQTRYLALGIFLLLGISALVLMVLWLGKQGQNKPTKQYVVEIRTDVNGLGNGSTVRYMGVDVGAVLEIKLHTAEERFVEVLIDIDEQLPVDGTTYATLVVQGVTGIANIDLGSDPSRSAPLATNPQGLPIIPFRATGLSAVLAGGGHITSSTRQLLKQLNAWTSAENLQHVVAILEDVESITDAMAQQRHEIPQIIAGLNSTIQRMDRTTKLLEAAVRDDLPVIAGDLTETSRHLASVSGRVDGWLAKNDQNIDRLLGEGVDSMADLMIDLRDLADELSGLSASLRTDPSRLIYQAKHDPVVAEP